MKITDPKHPQLAATARVMAWLDPMVTYYRVAFAASCAERLYPLYQAFSIDANWGNPVLLREAIDQLWNVASSDDRQSSPTDPGEILHIAPRSDEHASPFTFAAQYAVSCVIHAREATSAKTSDEATWCSIVSRDCIHDYLNWVAGPRFDAQAEAIDEGPSWIDWWDHPLMSSEMEKQFHDLKLISEADSLDRRLIHRLRTEGAIGIAPFRRQLIRESGAAGQIRSQTVPAGAVSAKQH